MGYYDTDIDLSDLLESDNYSITKAFEESVYSWTVDKDPTSETTSASGQRTDTGVRKKKYTKTRAPTPHRPQPIYTNRLSLR